MLGGMKRASAHSSNTGREAEFVPAGCRSPKICGVRLREVGRRPVVHLRGSVAERATSSSIGGCFG